MFRGPREVSDYRCWGADIALSLCSEVARHALRFRSVRLCVDEGLPDCFILEEVVHQCSGIGVPLYHEAFSIVCFREGKVRA